MKITRRGKALAVTVGALSVLAVGCNLPMPDPGMSLPPCATDSPPFQPSGCSWDASERGNGAGADFWVVYDTSRGTCYHYPQDSTLNICVPPKHP